MTRDSYFRNYQILNELEIVVVVVIAARIINYNAIITKTMLIELWSDALEIALTMAILTTINNIKNYIAIITEIVLIVSWSNELEIAMTVTIVTTIKNYNIDNFMKVVGYNCNSKKDKGFLCNLSICTDLRPYIYSLIKKRKKRSLSKEQMVGPWHSRELQIF